MKFICLSRVLRPLNIKGRTQTRPLSCGFDSSVGTALHRYRKGRGFESRSKPEFFSGHFSSSVMAALASFILSLLTAVGHLLP